MTVTSGLSRRPLQLADDGWSIEIIDQTCLPHELVVVRLGTLDAAVDAIVSMQVRGAPLIGVTAAYGLCLALMVDDSDASLEDAVVALRASRPTAVNLAHAVAMVQTAALQQPPGRRVAASYAAAARLVQAEIEACRAIGDHGLPLLVEIARQQPGPVRVLTHCNAGWLATLEHGTALAPVYRAHQSGVPVEVWVDETRPRGQGWLTAWELGGAGIPHTVIPDGMAAHLMQQGKVDVVLVGTDRTTRAGDVCNKIGTYGVALAAAATGVPFYAAVPSSSIDWEMTDWKRIPIEERSGEEVRMVRGRDAAGVIRCVAPGSGASTVRNAAFDVTPARLVTGLITERGVCRATRRGLLGLFPEQKR